MNAAVTDAMNRIADSPTLSAAVPGIVVVTLILGFIAREVLRVADKRHRQLSEDLVVIIVPLFIAGFVILASRILALALDG